MCGGSSKQKKQLQAQTKLMEEQTAIMAAEAAEVPDPTPIQQAPQPGETQMTTAAKRNKVAAVKYGAMSTIKNVKGAAGVSPNGVTLNSPEASAKKTIGS